MYGVKPEIDQQNANLKRCKSDCCPESPKITLGLQANCPGTPIRESINLLAPSSRTPFSRMFCSAGGRLSFDTSNTLFTMSRRWTTETLKNDFATFRLERVRDNKVQLGFVWVPIASLPQFNKYRWPQHALTLHEFGDWHTYTRDKPKRWLARPAPVEVRDRQWSLVGGS